MVFSKCTPTGSNGSLQAPVKLSEDYPGATSRLTGIVSRADFSVHSEYLSSMLSGVLPTLWLDDLAGFSPPRSTHRRFDYTPAGRIKGRIRTRRCPVIQIRSNL